MHAYGHEWACQLVFNPCLSVGLGLSDGEGTKHLWSCIIKLIGIESDSITSPSWFHVRSFQVLSSGRVTAFILEQVLAGSMSEASKYRVLEAQFRRWFCNFPAPFQDVTCTLSVTASHSSRTLPRLGSIRSIGKSSYFTFLTSNL